MTRSDTGTIGALEAAAARAWPALREISVGPAWVVRLADGFTKRANSVSPAAAVPVIDDAVRQCEGIFSRAGLPAVFRLTPLAPPALEPILAARGYRLVDDGKVLTIADLTAFRPDKDASVDSESSDQWIRAARECAAIDDRHLPTLQRMMRDRSTKRGFGILRQNGRIAACGMAALDGDSVGLFEIAVRPDLRARGLGRRLIGHLLHWGSASGARTGYLQVIASNGPACHLYRSLGFEETYGYRYRLLSPHRDPGGVP